MLYGNCYTTKYNFLILFLVVSNSKKHDEQTFYLFMTGQYDEYLMRKYIYHIHNERICLQDIGLLLHDYFLIVFYCIHFCIFYIQKIFLLGNYWDLYLRIFDNNNACYHYQSFLYYAD